MTVERVMPSDLSREMAAVLKWLLEHPTEYEAIRFIASAGTRPATVTHADRNRAFAYIGGAALQQCECLATTLWLPDGRTRSWPSLDAHECRGPLGMLLPEEEAPAPEAAREWQPRRPLKARYVG